MFMNTSAMKSQLNTLKKGLGLINVRIRCISLTFMTVNEESEEDHWLDKRSHLKTSLSSTFFAVLKKSIYKFKKYAYILDRLFKN